MSFSRAIPLLALALVLAACQARDDVEVTEEGWLQRGTEVVRDTMERTIRLGDRPLTLDVARGSITLLGEDVDEARFRFERLARAGSAAAAEERLRRIEIQEVGATDAYEITIPADRQRATELHLRATIPRNTPVTIRLWRGDVQLSELEGSIDVEATNGRVEAVELAGRQVRVRTIRGDQSIGFATLGAGSEVRLLAENGDLEIILPPDGSAQISVETGVGSIGIQDLTVSRERFEERPRDTRYRARLGDGRARLVGITGVGDIQLRGGGPAGIPAPVNAR